jgi:putative oxidoreductase
MKNDTQHLAALVGRILLAAMFLWSGVEKIMGYAGTAGYMTKAGLPMVEVLLPLTILVEVGGAILLIVGWKARGAALALCLFTLLSAILIHKFWAVPADQAYMETIQFMKNITICGGMLMVLAAGPGRYSVDKA